MILTFKNFSGMKKKLLINPTLLLRFMLFLQNVLYSSSLYLGTLVTPSLSSRDNGNVIERGAPFSFELT